jgi:histidinol-phosphate/aromatic aminotransferase/cobyric acid decarboxylase-like protein
MILAVSSYSQIEMGCHEGEILNLAWTADERQYLDLDIDRIFEGFFTNQDEDNAKCTINTYLVTDPYGEHIMRTPVSYYFGLESPGVHVTTGAGVNSLLYAFAHLAIHNPAYIVGDVYPDFVHWTNQLGGQCIAQPELATAREHAANILSCGASVVLCERPALSGTDVTLSDIRTLCERTSGSEVIILIDESYANYLPPGYSAAQLLYEVPNLAVLRGLSKAYWLGGLRIGICLASTRTTNRLRSFLPPMLCSPLSLRLAAMTLRLGDITTHLRKRIEEMKPQTITLLAKFGLVRQVSTSAFVPHIFFSDISDDMMQSLKNVGVMGKQQPFWTASTRSFITKFRLSTPLSSDRFEDLRRRLTHC